jgi:hypothetical protein
MQGEALSKTYEAVEKDMTLAADLSAHPSANMHKCEDRLADPGRAEYDTSCYFPSPSTPSLFRIVRRIANACDMTAYLHMQM